MQFFSKRHNKETLIPPNIHQGRFHKYVHHISIACAKEKENPPAMDAQMDFWLSQIWGNIRWPV